jgi:hypothetical protein
MKIESTTRIQYLKACRATIRRSEHASDAKWFEDMRSQLGLIAIPPVRIEAEERFERIVARRRSLNPNKPAYRKEVVQAFDALIEYLEQNDR